MNGEDRTRLEEFRQFRKEACPPSLLRWFGGVEVGVEEFFIKELGKSGGI